MDVWEFDLPGTDPVGSDLAGGQTHVTKYTLLVAKPNLTGFFRSDFEV
jgi:hypothetical protein